jgi:hypothetical protein
MMRTAAQATAYYASTAPGASRANAYSCPEQVSAAAVGGRSLRCDLRGRDVTCGGALGVGRGARVGVSTLDADNEIVGADLRRPVARGVEPADQVGERPQELDPAVLRFKNSPGDHERPEIGGVALHSVLD